MSSSRASNAAPKPTVEEIHNDPLTAVAQKHWGAGAKSKKLDDKLVTKIYEEELLGGDVSRAEILQYNGYLEQYLWPHFSTSCSKAHLMSIMMALNERGREGLPLWSVFSDTKQEFETFFIKVLELADDEELKPKELTAFVLFLVNVYQSLEEPLIRHNALRLVSLPIWLSMDQSRVELELSKYPQLRRHWKSMQASREKKEKTFAAKATPKKKGWKRKAKADTASKDQVTSEETLFHLEEQFFPGLVDRFLRTLEIIDTQSLELETEEVIAIERFIEFLVDLVSQLPTRRFTRTFLAERQVVVRCRLCSLITRPEGVLFSSLVDELDRYMHFEIDDHTGLALSSESMTAKAYSKVQILQRLSFNLFPDKLKDFALTSVGAVYERARLLEHLKQLTDDELRSLVSKLRIMPHSVNESTPLIQVENDDGNKRRKLESKSESSEQKSENGANADGAAASGPMNRELMIEVLLSEHAAYHSELEKLNGLPLYPDEELLWNPNLVPFRNYRGDRPLALPKLNLQFLSFYDYLLRSFQLFRLEAAYEIRSDLMDCITRLDPRKATAAGGIRGSVEYTRFMGWARMGVPLEKFEVTKVDKPEIGEEYPSQVKGEIVIDTKPYAEHIRGEWDQLKEHDVLFLVTIKSPVPMGVDRDRYDPLSGEEKKEIDAEVADEFSFPMRYGIVYVRGCEVVNLLDEDNNLLNDPAGAPDARVVGTRRTIQVKLDPCQYKADVERQAATGVDVYDTFNLVVRRRAKENNFKAILETVRDVMRLSSVGKSVPEWLHDIFLGYGDPAAAHYSNIPGQLRDIDFKDTFLSAKHIQETFPGKEITFIDHQGKEAKGKAVNALEPPFRVRFIQKRTDGGGDKVQTKEVIMAIAYKPETPSSLAVAPSKVNEVPFSPAQVEAIRSGMNPGLSLIVGPPGTGKTDVAVQTISNLYHNFPDQRILILTHSNQALNDIFSKIMQRDIDERFLLRLGIGERDLRQGTQKDFSKYGRVNHCLERRLQLLDIVEKLNTSLGLGTNVGYTCETAGHFYTYHVESKIKDFRSSMQTLHEPEASVVAEAFPFTDFFKTLKGDEPLFQQSSFEADMKAAEGYFTYLEQVFDELESYRAFELLRTAKLRGDYLVTKQAKIVAMTCTHAALARQKLVDLGFKFDSLIIEEAAQMMEIESFLPMLLQHFDAEEGCRLKRVTLIGDHNQLPPVVKNQAFQNYGHLDQSLFSRLIRLGVPAVHLDYQGRSRPTIAELFRWRYQDLKDFEHVKASEEYATANAGFAHEYQMVNVEDFEGTGEMQPSPFFYQNLGEAEYVVAVYQYMRLCGYAAEDISILTTYNGQKHLIRDIVQQRCSPYPFFGNPAHITTVDRFQGQQNKYILLSLVRTKSVGHLRDARRLVVAMSRAKLGLYVFGRVALFEQCAELSPVMSLLLKKPTKLQLVGGEHFPAKRKVDAKVSQPYDIEDVAHMGYMVHQMSTAAAEGQSQ